MKLFIFTTIMSLSILSCSACERCIDAINDRLEKVTYGVNHFEGTFEPGTRSEKIWFICEGMKQGLEFAKDVLDKNHPLAIMK